MSFLSYISRRSADLRAVIPHPANNTADSGVGFWNEAFKAFSLSQCLFSFFFPVKSQIQFS